MSDIKDLLNERSEHINAILAAVLRGDSMSILTESQDRGERLLDIDAELNTARRNGADIPAYLRQVDSATASSASKVDEHLALLTQRMQESGYKTAPSATCKKRVEEAILQPKNGRTPEGVVSSMAATTVNVEKLYARGLLLVQKGHQSLAQPLLEKVAQNFSVEPLDKAFWVDENVTVPVNMSDVFDMSNEQKLKTFNSLLVAARAMLARKLDGESEEELQREALLNFIGLLGVDALRAAHLLGD